MNEQHKVSIILPTYNGVKFLIQSIESCLKQTYKNIELIIVDDCSGLETQKIISSYNDPRINYIKKSSNEGLAAALNTGFSNAKGDYLTWTSDDNYYAPNAIKIMVNELNEGKAQFVYCQYHRINEKGKIIRFEKLKKPKHLGFGNYIGACFMYTQDVYKNIGDYRSDLKLVEDYEYWLRIREKYTMKLIEEPLYYYRNHGDSLSASWNTKEITELVAKTVDPYLTKTERTMVQLLKSFYDNNKQETKIILWKCFPRHILKLEWWRIMFLTYLNPQFITKIRELKNNGKY